jgi:hypothetical protein
MSLQNELCFVQFIHPGREHEPDARGKKGWNDGPHKRKFVETNGRCLRNRESGNHRLNSSLPCEVLSRTAIIFDSLAVRGLECRAVRGPFAKRSLLCRCRKSAGRLEPAHSTTIRARESFRECECRDSPLRRRREPSRHPPHPSFPKVHTRRNCQGARTFLAPTQAIRPSTPVLLEVMVRPIVSDTV